MIRRLVAAVVVLVIAGLAAALWWQVRRADRAEAEAGLGSARVLSAVFTQTADLRVATLTGTVVAQSESDGPFVHAEQTTRAPYSVSYVLDLKRITPADLRWNPDTRTLRVVIPDVHAEAPAIDMARAQIRQQGLWISRSAGIDLQRTGFVRLRDKAKEKADSNKFVDEARAAAVRAVEGFVAAPLRAAGYGDVTVEVRFGWQRGGDGAQMDRSRSLAEVFADG